MEATLPFMPRWVGTYAERAIAARGSLTLVGQLLDSSEIPIVIFDDDRRYLEANRPAEMALAASRDDLLQHRLDDLTPEHLRVHLPRAWARFLENGVWAGPTSGELPENGTWLGIVYYFLAHVLPGRHLNAFAPMGWPGAHSSAEVLELGNGRASLTPRELEVLQLAAGGSTGPTIADQLCVSQATVNTHFQHIYNKLGVNDRAAAVAKAMRQGLIS